MTSRASWRWSDARPAAPLDPLLAVLVALGFFLLRPKPEENQATAFQVVEATRGDLRVTVSGYGWLSPWETLEVRPEITGTLVWLAEEGQEVQEGEVVARLDPTPFARALAEAEAEVRRQEANLENARLEGQSALASLTASVKSAEIAYANAKQDLETARQNLGPPGSSTRRAGRAARTSSPPRPPTPPPSGPWRTPRRPWPPSGRP